MPGSGKCAIVAIRLLEEYSNVGTDARRRPQSSSANPQASLVSLIKFS